MNLPEFSIRRPVTTTLIMVAILLFGILGFRLLPVSDLPNVDFPIILVSAALPGANPETMASAVATPLEKQFATIAGIDSMTSASGIGVTQITLQFSLSRNLDAAAQDVQAAISAVQRQLPQNMPAPPSYQKVNPADQPILFIALTSPDLPLYQLDEYGETLMAQRISDGERRGAGEGLSARRSTPCASNSTRPSWRTAGSGLTRWPARCRTRT